MEQVMEGRYADEVEADLERYEAIYYDLQDEKGNGCLIGKSIEEVLKFDQRIVDTGNTLARLRKELEGAPARPERWELNRDGWNAIEAKIIEKHGSVEAFMEMIYNQAKEEYQSNDYGYFDSHTQGMITMLKCMLENYLD